MKRREKQIDDESFGVSKNYKPKANTGKANMDAAMEKIWKAVKGLDQADVHSAALCHSIINLMINQGIVTEEEVARQIEKSVSKVVLVHKKIIKAMQDQQSGAGGFTGPQTLQ